MLSINWSCLNDKHIWCEWLARVVRMLSTYGADA
mgnify:FL=1